MARYRHPIALLTLFALTAASPAQTTYHLTDLGVLPGADYAVPFGLNEAGDVVGRSGNGLDERAFFWHAGVMYELPSLPGATWTEARGINAVGQIVGTAYVDGQGVAVVWNNGVPSILPELPDSLGTEAFAINDAGQIAGTDYGHPHAVRWDDGVPTDLGVLPGGLDLSFGVAINASGAVAGHGEVAFNFGSRAALWQCGQAINLGLLPGRRDSRAYGINDAGMVVGDSDGQPFVWQNGVMSPLEAGQSGGVANDINNMGQIVGRIADSNIVGVIWDPQHGRLILNDRLDSSGAGWDISEALAINDAGQIIAIAGTPTGGSAAVLLTPVHACPPCDTNCDGSVNQFDIQPFINTLISHAGCSPCAGDINGNGTVNQFDISGFINCLVP